MEKEVKYIRAAAASPADYVQRVWKYRRLIGVLCLRDMKGTYTQTMLGWLWLIIKPLLVLLLFTVFFDQLLALDTGSIPYAPFAFAGMSLWYFFSNLVNSTGNAVHQSTDLMRKIYFPRIILLLSKSLVASVELGVHLLILLIVTMSYGYAPTLQWLIILPMVVVVYLCGLTVGLWLSNLSIRHRDLQHLVPQLVNLAIWLTPVFYPVSIIPDQYRDWLYILNPMASTIDGLRFGLFGTGDLPAQLLINIAVVVILLGAGIFTFIREERTLIDRL